MVKSLLLILTFWSFAVFSQHADIHWIIPPGHDFDSAAKAAPPVTVHEQVTPIQTGHAVPAKKEASDNYQAIAGGLGHAIGVMLAGALVYFCMIHPFVKNKSKTNSNENS